MTKIRLKSTSDPSSSAPIKSGGITARNEAEIFRNKLSAGMEQNIYPMVQEHLEKVAAGKTGEEQPTLLNWMVDIAKGKERVPATHNGPDPCYLRPLRAS